MRRREFLALLGGIALARPTAALGQEAVRRMGMLMPFAEDDPEAVIRVGIPTKAPGAGMGGRP